MDPFVNDFRHFLGAKKVPHCIDGKLHDFCIKDCYEFWAVSFEFQGISLAVERAIAATNNFILTKVAGLSIFDVYFEIFEHV